MQTSEIRHQVLMHINYADERLLKLIKALAECYQEDQLKTTQQTRNHQSIKPHKNKLDNSSEWEEVQAIW